MPYAVITGATQGIGKAIAARLLDEGFSIAFCGRNTQALDALQKEWSALYPSAKVLAYTADLGMRNNINSFAAAVLSAFPAIDVLVNNAGTFTPGGIASEPDGNLEHLMSVNLYSAYYLTRALLPAMRQNGSGHIFNMCSVASLRAYPAGGSYSISKYALLGFSDNLRHELMDQNIRVTALCPGAVYTASWEGSGVAPERIMEANDIAEMVWASYKLSARANVETIVMRPLRGDL